MLIGCIILVKQPIGSPSGQDVAPRHLPWHKDVYMRNETGRWYLWACFKAITDHEEFVLRISYCPPDKANKKEVATNEIRILTTLHCQHIIQSHEIFEVGDLVILVLDLYEGGVRLH